MRAPGRRRGGLLALRLAVGLVYLFLLGPIVVVMLLSVSESVSLVTLDSLTLRWYAKLLANDAVLGALWFSVQIGVLSALISLSIGGLAAFGIVRHRFPGRGLLQAALFSPMVVPEIITAVALLSYFAFLQLPRGYLTLVIGHTLLILPYVVSVVSARLYGFDRTLEEAAQNLGASPCRLLVEVTFPLLAPALITALLIAFKVSFDEVVGSVFWSSAQQQTLPVLVFAMLRFELTPEVNAIGTVMVVISLSILSIFQLISLQRERRQT